MVDPPHSALAVPDAGPRLTAFLDAGVVQGDSLNLIPQLATGSVALFFTSPPYADQRGYSRIHPDH